MPTRQPGDLPPSPPSSTSSPPPPRDRRSSRYTSSSRQHQQQDDDERRRSRRARSLDGSYRRSDRPRSRSRDRDRDADQQQSGKPAGKRGRPSITDRLKPPPNPLPQYADPEQRANRKAKEKESGGFTWEQWMELTLLGVVAAVSVERTLSKKDEESAKVLKGEKRPDQVDRGQQDHRRDGRQRGRGRRDGYDADDGRGREDRRSRRGTYGERSRRDRGHDGDDGPREYGGYYDDPRRGGYDSRRRRSQSTW